MKLNRLYIEITNVCNMKCSFCIQNSRESSFMDVDMFENLISSWKTYSDYIYLHVLGEPLMHPQLDSILGLCDKYEMKVTITTNGSLLKERYPILVSHPSIRQINISVHNFKEQNIDMAVYVENCIFAGGELAKQQIYVNYRFWNLNDGKSDEETKEVLTMFEKAFSMNFQLMKQQIGDYQYIHFDEVFEWPSLELPYLGERGKCLGTRSQIGILVDGTLIPCCLDAKKQIPLGNIKENSLDELLQSDRYLAMKQGFEDNKAVEELCKHCSFKSRFKI